MAVRAIAVVLILGAAAGCTTPLRIDGAPCPCPTGYSCDHLHNQCVIGAVTITERPEAGVPDTQPAGCAIDPGPPIARLLDASEYANTVRDLLGVTVDTSGLSQATALPIEAANYPRTTPSALLPEVRSPYAKAAEDAAAKAVEHLSTLLPCPPDPPGQSACAQQFAQSFGARAYRRPLEGSELEALLTAFREGPQDPAGQLGIHRLIVAALTAPQFLFVAERGATTGPRPGVVALTPWEIAARLSYFLAATMPDDRLRQRVLAGQLTTADDVRAAAEALLASPNVAPVVDTFHRRWLSLADVQVGDKPIVTPPFDAGLQAVLIDAGARTASLPFWALGLDQAALFGGLPLGDRAMADFYGWSPPAGSGLEELTPLGDQKRFGILTAPALLAALASEDESNPVKRGHFLAQEILCRELPPVPSNITVPPVRDPDPNATTRQRFSEHVTNPSCMGCHMLMDPLGFGLENYDGYGRWRTQENGQTIDASGLLDVAPPTPFAGPGELAALLGKSDEVSTCLVRQWLRFALGRKLTDSDQCAVDAIRSQFIAGGRKLQPLLLAIATSEAFLTRQAP